MEVPPFDAHLGARVERIADGLTVARLELKPHHLNGAGIVHGGVYSALLDTAMGSAVVSAMPRDGRCATTSLSIQYLAGSSQGTLRAEGKVVRLGFSVAFVSGELRDDSGALLATAHGTWHVSVRRPDAAQRDESEPCVALRGSGERLHVGKIVAVGRNYADHIKEMGGAASALPVLFLKPPSAIVHEGGAIRIPPDAGEMHHEVELVVVIGRGGRAIAEEEALDHVLGYAVGLDMTLRDIQAAAKAKGEPWAVAKGFDTSAAISAVAPRDEVGDGSGLEITLDVNGDRRQHASTSQMLHSIAALIAHVSRWMTLHRGDLLFTGTPAGVGPVHAGDRIEARIEKIGSLRVTAASG